MLKLLIWATYKNSYLLILNCLHRTTSEQLVIPNPEKNRFSHASFFFCNLLWRMKKKLKIRASFPGNCLVSTDVSRFDNLFFFKLHYWLMWKTTQKQIWCFCASTQYCHNTSLLTADLIIRITMSTQEQELKMFLETLASMRPKFGEVLFHRICFS